MVPRSPLAMKLSPQCPRVPSSGNDETAPSDGRFRSIGAPGFEPGTSPDPNGARYGSALRHAPIRAMVVLKIDYD